MTPIVGKYYWIRLYRDTAAWQPAQRQQSEEAVKAILSGGGKPSADYCWKIPNSELEWFDTEVNEIGPEIIPPPQ